MLGVSGDRGTEDFTDCEVVYLGFNPTVLFTSYVTLGKFISLSFAFLVYKMGIK